MFGEMTEVTPRPWIAPRRNWLRSTGKWLARAVLVLLLLLALDIAILAFPSPLFAHKQNFGEFTVYANHAIPDECGDIVEEARQRIQAMERPRPGASYRVYICGNQRLYSLFAFLTRRGADSLAIGLSTLGNMYLNETKIRRFAAANHADIRHSRFEGNFAEVIAHEIVHFNMVESLGFRAALKLPVWKSEGYAEYQANLATSRMDSTYSLPGRIEVLLNDAVWGRGDSPARRHFAWHVMVEYLAEVKGLSLEELADANITATSSHAEMLTWYRIRPE